MGEGKFIKKYNSLSDKTFLATDIFFQKPSVTLTPGAYTIKKFTVVIYGFL
jgi:hypothetical protein